MTNLAFASAMLAQVTMPTASPDPRMQVAVYEADTVVSVEIAAGFATMIEFAPQEHVDTVIVGNSAGWQVTASQAANQLVVKPLLGAIATNMIVVTDLRRYVFMLDQGGGGDSSPFVLRFVYPEKTQTSALAAPRTAEFKLRGDRTILPLDMYDDGQRTTIVWDRRTILPAIFAVKGGLETLVNGRMNGPNYVIEGVAQRFVFRAGHARGVADRRRPHTPRP